MKNVTVTYTLEDHTATAKPEWQNNPIPDAKWQDSDLLTIHVPNWMAEVGATFTIAGIDRNFKIVSVDSKPEPDPEEWVWFKNETGECPLPNDLRFKCKLLCESGNDNNILSFPETWRWGFGRGDDITEYAIRRKDIPRVKKWQEEQAEAKDWRSQVSV